MKHKLLMENWRKFVAEVEAEDQPDITVDNLYENHRYITEILGVSIPLDESGVPTLSEELREQVLQEHLLFEGFLGSLVASAKKAGGRIKDLLVTLAKILKDPDAMSKFIDLLKKEIVQPLFDLFKQAFEKLKKLASDKKEKAGQAVDKMSSGFSLMVDKFIKMAGGWKTAMYGASVALLLAYTDDAAGDALKSFVKEEDPEEAKEKGQDILSFFSKEKLVGAYTQMKDMAVEALTDAKTWLGMISPIVGGVDFIATALEPVTSKMKVSKEEPAEAEA